MNKFIKISLSCLIGLPLLVLLALVLFIQFQDANRYKADIEKQAKKHIGLNLSIEGNLEWSLLPLGIDINKIKIDDQSNQSFTSIDRVLAQIDLFSLFRASPSIHTLLIDGAQVNLIEDENGKANWLNILPEKNSTAATKTNETNDEKETEPTKDKGELSFLLSRLELANLNLNFVSKPKNQNIKLSPLNILLSYIAPNSDIPLEISFVFEDTVQALLLKTNILGKLSFSSDFTEISLKSLSSKFEVSGDITQSEVIHASLDSQLHINTKTQAVSIPELSLILEQLKLESQIEVNNYADALELEGQFHLLPFSPKDVANKFKVQLPELSSPDSLEKLSLKSDVSLVNDQLHLKQIEAKLDESTWQGDLQFHTLSQALKLALKGDKLNLDNYLPKQESSSTQTTESKELEPTASPLATDLLPLDTTRKLDLDISFEQKELIAKKVLVENINLQTTAKKGLITLKDLSAKSHEGTFITSAKLDARTNTPIWKAKTGITQLNLASLIQALEIQKAEDFASISGALNFETSLSTQGNNIDSLKKNAISDSQFEVLQGEIQGINLKALSCKGLALINRDDFDINKWPSITPFDTLKGSAALNKEVLTSRFDLVSAGLTVDAEGPVNINKNSLDLRMALKVTGDPKEKACRVNEKFKDIPIPVRCKGKFDTPPAELCSLDEKRLLKASKELAVKEGKRKLQKELNRTLKKHLGDNEEVKDAAKKFFKKLF